MSPNFTGCKNKPINCSSLAARSFWLHARLCQLCGCFFIRDIFCGANKEARKICWKSRYTLYSCGCVVLMGWMASEAVFAWIRQWPEQEEHFEIGLHLTIHTMLFLRVTVNYLCMLSGSSKLVSFYRCASAYEKRVRILPCECCSTRHIFWSDARRCCVCVLYAVAIALTEPQEPNEPKDPLAQTIHFSKILLITMFWLVYDIMYSVSLKSSAQAICEYIDHEIQVLRNFEGDNCAGFDRRAAMARRIEDVRLNVFALLQLKRNINDVWRWSLVVSSVYAIVVPCLCVYEACRGAFAPEQRYALVLYAIYTACDFGMLAQASHSLMKRVRKLKDACRTFRSSGNAGLQYQIQRLLDSIDPEAMAFQGADFFILKLPLVVEITASVITYAVVLQQTTQRVRNSRGPVV